MSQSAGVINSFFWKACERIMVQGIGIVVQIILARLLLPEDFACLAIINAIISFLGLFVQSGLSITVIQKKDLSDKDLSTLVTISLLVALVLFIILFFLAPAISNYYNVGDLVWPIRVMGVSLFLFSFNSIQTGLLTRKMQFKTIFFRSMLATPLSGIIGVFLAYSGFGIWALVVYNIANIFLIVVFMNMIPDLRLKIGFSWKSAKELYSFSLKILGTSVVCSGGDTIRTLTIGKVYTPAQLAYFDRGLTYSNLVTQVVNTSLSSVLLPTFSRSQDDISRLNNMARRSVSLSAYIMIPLLVLVSVMSEPLVLIVLSEKWLPCAIFLSLFCLLRIPGIITSIDKQVYYALGKSQIGLYYEIGLLIANLLSLFLMIPHGVFAIAIGFTVVEYIGNLVLCIISSKVFGYSLKDRFLDLWHTVFYSSIIAVIVYAISLFHFNVWVQVLLQLLSGIVSFLLLSSIMKDKNLNLIISIVKEKGWIK